MPPNIALPATLAALGGLLALALSGGVTVVLAGAVLGALVGGFWAASPVGSLKDTLADSPAVETTPFANIHAVLDAMPMGALVVSGNRTILAANAEVRSLFGASAVAGQPAAVLRSPALLDSIDQAFTEDRAQKLDLTLWRAGDRFLFAEVAPISGGQDPSVLIVLRDETAAKRAAEVHRDFVANASHELKTPLAAASGIIETLMGPAREDRPATERFLKLLSSQTTRMQRLVEDLLSLNRIELNARVAPEAKVPLVPMLAEVIDTLGPIAREADVQLDFEPPTPSPIVVADRNEIGQLFRNLIDNAIKYGGSGTTVSVEILPGTKEGRIGVAIRDQGPGIAREHLPRLTERFYRVNALHSREKGGTGLGLAICKHVLARHRGRLEIDSELGRGSCFVAWLPGNGAAAADQI